HRDSAVMDVFFLTLVPWPVGVGDGSDRSGKARPRVVWIQERRDLVARCRSRHLQASAQQTAEERTADLPLCRPGRAREEHRGLPRVESTRLEVGCRRGARIAGYAGTVSEGELPRRARPARAGAGVRLG